MLSSKTYTNERLDHLLGLASGLFCYEPLTIFGTPPLVLKLALIIRGRCRWRDLKRLVRRRLLMFLLCCSSYPIVRCIPPSLAVNRGCCYTSCYMLVDAGESNKKKFGQFSFSLFLALLAGYGFRPVRSLITYLIIIFGFMGVLCQALLPALNQTFAAS